MRGLSGVSLAPMDAGVLLVTFGLLCLTGLAADQIGRFTRLPRVTMLLLLGIMVGEAGLGLVPAAVVDWFDTVSIVALTMVAFLLGGVLTRSNLAAHGRAILSISIAVVLVTMAMVAGGLMLLGLDPGTSLLLGAIATSTAPAAISDVVEQSGIRNGFTDTLQGVVAIDDAWGLVVFSIALALASDGEGWASVAEHAARDLGGAVVIGVLLGIPAAYLTGRLKPGEPQQAEAIGIVFLTGGLALVLDVSYLVAGMTAGAIVANFARHHDRAFHEIENIRWPFLLLFFLLAGVTLDPGAILALGVAGAAFVGLRILARMVGGWIGARLAGVPRSEALWYGPALLPQAGVAVGMALVAGDALPGKAAAIMAATVASTVFFELFGPPVTMIAIRRSSAWAAREQAES